MTCYKCNGKLNAYSKRKSESAFTFVGTLPVHDKCPPKKKKG